MCLFVVALELNILFLERHRLYLKMKKQRSLTLKRVSKLMTSLSKGRSSMLMLLLLSSPNRFYFRKPAEETKEAGDEGEEEEEETEGSSAPRR